MKYPIPLLTAMITLTSLQRVCVQLIWQIHGTKAAMETARGYQEMNERRKTEAA